MKLRRWVVLSLRYTPDAFSYPVSLHWFRWTAQRAVRRWETREAARRSYALGCGLAYHGVSYWLAPATGEDREQLSRAGTDAWA